MTFQVLNYKRNYFFDLLNDDYLPIKSTYTKDSTQLKFISYFNSLYTRVTKAITNYTSIGKYYLRFFPKENFNCLYKSYPIKSRYYILHKYKRYNNYQNPNRESLNYFVVFLKFNSEAFSFHKEITEQQYYCFSLLSYISSYIVATTVHHHISYNKMLIFE